MNFERTQDWELIRSIVTHKRIWEHVSDDFSGPREEWQPIQNELVWYLLVKEEEEVLGLFTLIPHNGICWDVHTTLLPKCWGAKSRRAASEAMHWVFNNTPAKRLVTEVPDGNTLALHLAHDAGMEQYGFNPDSYQKNGVTCGVRLLGITKGNGKCQ